MEKHHPVLFKLIAIVVLLSLSAPAHPANTSTWLKGALCGALLGGAVVSGPVLVDDEFRASQIVSRFQKIQKSYELNSDGSVRGFISTALNPIVMGPTRSILKSMELRMNGMDHANSLLATIGDIGLYTALVFGVKGLQRMFFSVPHETFLAKSGRRLTSDPRSVLFLDFIGLKDRLSGYADATFSRLYSDHSDAHFIRFEDIEQLSNELKTLNGKHFDRIEIMAHGQPGYIMANDKEGNKVSGEDIAHMFSSLGFTLSHNQTELRLISCSLLNGQGVNETYDSRLAELLTTILPSGGRAVGVAKNILTFELAPNPVGYERGDSQWLDSGMVFLAYMLNAEVLRTIFSSVFSLNRNYLDALNEVIVLNITQTGQIERAQN